MIYRFRILLDNDTDDNIFRDIEIRRSDTFEDLHNAITQSFGFDGTEMASFYLSDETWNQGEEITLFDMNEGSSSVRLMNESYLQDVLDEDHTRMIYVYDFLNMWTFLVELGEIVEEANGTDYPNLMYVHGQIPTEAPAKLFEVKEHESESDKDEDVDIDDYGDLDFDENWN